MLCSTGKFEMRHRVVQKCQDSRFLLKNEARFVFAIDSSFWRKQILTKESK